MTTSDVYPIADHELPDGAMAQLRSLLVPQVSSREYDEILKHCPAAFFTGGLVVCALDPQACVAAYDSSDIDILIPCGTTRLTTDHCDLVKKIVSKFPHEYVVDYNVRSATAYVSNAVVLNCVPIDRSLRMLQFIFCHTLSGTLRTYDFPICKRLATMDGFWTPKGMDVTVLRDCVTCRRMAFENFATASTNEHTAYKTMHRLLKYSLRGWRLPHKIIIPEYCKLSDPLRSFFRLFSALQCLPFSLFRELKIKILLYYLSPENIAMALKSDLHRVPLPAPELIAMMCRLENRH